MYNNFDYSVGCIESLDYDSALMGMFIFSLNSRQPNVLIRSATRTYPDRNFECIGVKIAAVDNISLVYTATAQSAQVNHIFIVTLKVDPIAHPLILSEQILTQMKYEATQRTPQNLTQYIDCFIGELCEIYFSIFSLANQCSDEVTINKMYILGISINEGDLNYNTSEYSTMIHHIKVALNKLPVQFDIQMNKMYKMGVYEFLFSVKVEADIDTFQPKTYNTYSFKFEVYSQIGQFFINNTAPYFLSSLKDIEATVGIKKIVDLPEIRDDEGDNFTVQIIGKQASLFLYASQKKLFINPVQPVVGKHTVTIIEWDQLIVSFKMNFLFYDKTEKLMMQKGYQIKGYIPPQISQGLKDLLSIIGTSTSISLQSIMGSNIVVNILLQVDIAKFYFRSQSIQQLWGMINSFQLITHIPLMGINTPANVAIFYSFILDVSSFQFFDVEKINSFIFDYDSDSLDDSTYNPYYERMGYSSTNLIRNLGLIFYFYCLLMIMMLLVYVLNFVKIPIKS
ncbi:UNKNOWN [Stylonychia lemnae]|uniref:Uncharacterized protein n=1 Tax=Stylonychia lemnae TaxID=5949 RepID=A0A078B0U6_STYLE|nr:UNKNOWN [Stylonychia lemnae]|eukprot:CDW87921.1 UNKNOWN [Stylonychia lemnae]